MLFKHQLALYCAVGVVNTLFGYSVFAMLVYAGWFPAMALLLATCIGVVFNYFSTGRVVFGQRGTGRLPRFVIAYAVVYLCNVSLMEMGIMLGASSYVAGAMSMLCATAMAFVLNRHFVFAEKK